MSMPPLDPAEPVPDPMPVTGHEHEPEHEPAVAGAPAAPRGDWTLVALIADDGQEPAANLPDRAALAAWCAVSALWHPSLLAQAGALPRIESVDCPGSPGPNEVRVLAEGTAERLPSGYLTQVEDAGTILIEGGTDRPALVRAIQARLGLDEGPEAESQAGKAD